MFISSSTEKQVLHTHGLPHMSAKGRKGLVLGAPGVDTGEGGLSLPFGGLGTCPQHRQLGPGLRAAGTGGGPAALRLPCMGRGVKHQGTPGTVVSKQQPASKHCSLVMPGKPQFFLLSGFILEHWQGAVERCVTTLRAALPRARSGHRRVHQGNAKSCLTHMGQGFAAIVSFVKYIKKIK